MLHHSDFNGKRDVLHFKLLQAAINENNAKKACEQNAENLNENLDRSRKYMTMNNEIKPNSEHPRDTHNFQYRNNQYHNFNANANNDYEPRVKKQKIIPEHSSFGSELQSKKKIKHPSATKFKPTSSYFNQPLSLSTREKLHKPSRDKRKKLKRVHNE